MIFLPINILETTLNSHFSFDTPLQTLYDTISKAYDLSSQNFYIIYHAKPLNPSLSLSDYGLSSKSVLQVMHRLPGGQPKRQFFLGQGKKKSNQRRMIKRGTTFEILNRVYENFDLNTEKLSKERIKNLKMEIEYAVRRGMENFWDELDVLDFQSTVMRIACCNNKDTIIIADELNKFHFYSVDKRKITHNFQFVPQDAEKVTSIAVNYTDKFLFVGTSEGNLYIYELPKCTEMICRIPKGDIDYYSKLESIEQIVTLRIILPHEENIEQSSPLKRSETYDTPLLQSPNSSEKPNYTDNHDDIEYLIVLDTTKQISFYEIPKDPIIGFIKFKEERTLINMFTIQGTVLRKTNF